jgi:alanine dehydrogenase
LHSAKQFFLKEAWVRPGTFIAAVGADNEDKQELEPAQLIQSKLVVDMLEQATRIGELHHSPESNLMTKADVYAELGEGVAGRKSGRSTAVEIIIFDSTGMALQDVIVAAAVYEKAVRIGLGQLIDFGGKNVSVNQVSAG